MQVTSMVSKRSGQRMMSHALKNYLQDLAIRFRKIYYSYEDFEASPVEFVAKR